MLIWSANFGDSGAWRKVRLVAGSFRNTRAPDTCRARRNKPSQRKEPRMCVGKAWRCRRQHKCQDGRQASRRRLAISGAYQRGHEHRRSSMSSFKIVFGRTRRTSTGHRTSGANWTSCKLFRQRASNTVRVTLTTGDTEILPRQCPLCRRPQSTIDANHRRHPSKPTRSHHRRHHSSLSSKAPN